MLQVLIGLLYYNNRSPLQNCSQHLTLFVNVLYAFHFFWMLTVGPADPLARIIIFIIRIAIDLVSDIYRTGRSGIPMFSVIA